MTISPRTATSGTAAGSAAITPTLPSGVSFGDLLVLVIGNASTSTPTAPAGWTTQYQASAGSSQLCSLYTAPYTPALSLAFSNGTGVAAWVCNAYFEAGFYPSTDGAAVAATSITSDTTLPTGAPTTGAAAGDYEVLAYTWTSGATISAVAAGSTIDRTQANGTSVSVALGHNNTTSLGASTVTTAFNQTLSAANTRKTGVGLLLKSPVPATRQIGSLDLNVDVAPPLLRQPQIGALAFNVDFAFPKGVQYGGLGITVDAQTNPARCLSAVGVMVDFIPSLIPTTAVRWSGSAFEMGTAAAVVRWTGTAFTTTGGDPIVVWEDDTFGVAP